MEDVLGMDWGGHRNLALRARLGLTRNEVGLVDMNRTVQLVVKRHMRAKEMVATLERDLPDGYKVIRHQRDDGRFVVTAYREGEDLDELTAGLVESFGG